MALALVVELDVEDESDASIFLLGFSVRLNGGGGGGRTAPNPSSALLDPVAAAAAEAFPIAL